MIHLSEMHGYLATTFSLYIGTNIEYIVHSIEPRKHKKQQKNPP